MSEILRELVAAGGEIFKEHLVRAAGGNVSAREDDTVWISPAGFSLLDAGEGDYAGVSLQTGEVVHGKERPSSEIVMHLGIYRCRPDINAIVHAHPLTAKGLTAAGHTLKAMFPEYYAYLGHNVPHLPYTKPTSSELADQVEEAARAEDCFGIILGNHGTLTMGATVQEAYFRTVVIEEQAIVQHTALQVGEPRFLTPEELAEIDQVRGEAYWERREERMKGGERKA